MAAVLTKYTRRDPDVSDYDVLLQLFQHVEANKKEEGLYRINGKSATVKMLLECLRKGEPVPALEDTKAHYAYASAAKEIIRDNRLIEGDKLKFGDFKKNAEKEKKNAEKKKKKGEEAKKYAETETAKLVGKIAPKLTEEKRRMLKRVFQHVVGIAAEGETNKMDMKNLSIVFGQSVIHCEKKTSSEEDFHDTNYAMKEMLEYYNDQHEDCFDEQTEDKGGKKKKTKKA